MKIVQEQLLGLTYLAIHPEKQIPQALSSEIVWRDVFEEAKKQSLVGVAFIGFKRWLASGTSNRHDSSIDKRLYTDWFAMTESIREDNLRVNRRTAQVCRNLAKDGLRTSVMKGQGNALLYGQELMLMRTSGDIDVWVEGGFQKVYDYVMSKAPTKKVSEKDIIFNAFSDTEVEVHYRPYVMRNPFRDCRLQQFFAAQSESCFTNNIQLPTVNTEGENIMMSATVTTVSFNLVHQLAHIHRHLFAVGMGLRHVMDYYFQLIYAEKTLCQDEKEEVIRVVKSIGLERLAKALTWILSAYLGLPQSCQLWNPCKEDGEFLLEDILKTGNFGHGDESLFVGIKAGGIRSLFKVLKHNIALSRFDKTDWIWGPLYRIYYFFWRKIKGYS